MKNYLRWLMPTREVPHARPALPRSTTEQKTFASGDSGSGSGFIALAGGGRSSWSQTDYATMARKGYMANPIVFRCVRLISETAAAVPLLIYEGVVEQTSIPFLICCTTPT